MNIQNAKQKPLNLNGAAIFKKMLEDKKAIHEHLQSGGNLTDLKDKYTLLHAYPLQEKGK